MRFLSINHLRLGSAPGGIPLHLATDTRAYSSRIVWQRAVAMAQQHGVQAVLLSGQTLSPTNSGLEPWGPLIDGLAELRRAEITVIAIAEGEFTPVNLARFAPEDSVHWLDDTLEWEPLFTTSLDPFNSPTVHVVPGSFAQSPEAPVHNPVTLQQIDQRDSIWLLTDAWQPDQISGEHALIIEPGSPVALSGRETGRHGAWMIDTEAREAQLIPLASLEFVSIDADISDAADLDDLERVISAALVNAATAARNDGSIADTLLADITITGSSQLYPELANTAEELQRMLVIEHDDMKIAISRVSIDATPRIELEPLLSRPDPVGEVARLINALATGDELSEAQSRLLTAVEQKLLSVSHARVFGSILDLEPDADAPTLLRRQGWVTLDALVRQRGID